MYPVGSGISAGAAGIRYDVQMMLAAVSPVARAWIPAMYVSMRLFPDPANNRLIFSFETVSRSNYPIPINHVSKE